MIYVIAASLVFLTPLVLNPLREVWQPRLALAYARKRSGARRSRSR